MHACNAYKVKDSNSVKNILDIINDHIHQASWCGEYAVDFLDSEWSKECGKQIREGYLYIWDPGKVDPKEVAQWFFNAGAEDVTILKTLYDSFNSNVDGLTPDGCEAWTIRYDVKKSHNDSVIWQE
jgi:hypothetical protein